MKKTLLTGLVLQMVLGTLTWATGCGGDEPATPQKAEEIRKQHVQRAERMQQDLSKSK